MFKVTLLLSTTIILIFMCGGCTSNEQPEKNLKQWYYEDGTLKKEQEYINDSTEHGIYRFFHPSGVLKDSTKIIYNKFHGKRFEYHENGKLYILTKYINDNYRSAIDYRSDGTLEYYRAYNYHKELMFIIHYDGLGKPIKHDGYPIYSWVREKNYAIGEKFSVELLLANPPNCKAEVIISDWDIEKRQAKNQQKYVPDEFNRIIYSRKQNPEKDMYILHIASIEDTVTQKFFSDTLVFKVAKDGKSDYMRNLPK